VRIIQGPTRESFTDTSVIAQSMDNTEPGLTNHDAESAGAHGVSEEGMSSEVHTLKLQCRFPQRTENRRNFERPTRRMCTSLR
jgi:hypothetical protein